MKLTRKSWLILGIGVFVIAFASLYMVYRQQEGEQERLNLELATAQATLPQLVSERENLESQLTQLKSDLTQAKSWLREVKDRFPRSTESIEYDELLFEIADGCNLEITNLTASELVDQEVETVTYAVTFFEVRVRGEVADMLDYVNSIATGEYFTTATVEWVNISVHEPVTEEETEEEVEEEEVVEEFEIPLATIKFVVYSYRGE